MGILRRKMGNDLQYPYQKYAVYLIEIKTDS